MAHATAPRAVPSGPLTLHGHDVEGVNRCVHCGLCLAYCPTFSLLGTEMDSPRGRIFLIKSMAEGRIGLTSSAAQHLDLVRGDGLEPVLSRHVVKNADGPVCRVGKRAIEIENDEPIRHQNASRPTSSS